MSDVECWRCPRCSAFLPCCRNGPGQGGAPAAPSGSCHGRAILRPVTVDDRIDEYGPTPAARLWAAQRQFFQNGMRP